MLAPSTSPARSSEPQMTTRPAPRRSARSSASVAEALAVAPSPCPRATACGSVSEALERALRLGAGRVVICGSLYLAGEVLGASRETWPD